MTLFSMRIPDDPSWFDDRGYSPTVAYALIKAYAHLAPHQNKIHDIRRAYAFVAPVQASPMSRRQRAHVLFIHSLFAGAVEDYPSAIARLEDALELSLGLGDQGALVDLLYLHASLQQVRLDLPLAAEGRYDCLGLLRTLKADVDLALDATSLLQGSGATGEADDARLDDERLALLTLELEVLNQLAGIEFYLGRYEAAEDRLREAEHLVPLVPDGRLEAATITWLRAMLARWRRQPQRALPLAREAAAHFTEAGSPASAARIQILSAESALDQARRLPMGSARDGLIAQARPHVELADNLAREAGDAIGEGMARLTYVYWSRQRGRNEDRIALIEPVLHRARWLGDHALLAQGFTALADELMSLGFQEAALAHYRDVLGVLDGSGLAALEVWARAALHRAREGRDADE